MGPRASAWVLAHPTPPPPRAGCWEKAPAPPTVTPSPPPVTTFQPPNAPPSTLQVELGGNVHGEQVMEVRPVPKAQVTVTTLSQSLGGGGTQEIKTWDSWLVGVPIHPPLHTLHLLPLPGPPRPSLPNILILLSSLQFLDLWSGS